NGYLTTPLDELATLLPQELDIDRDDWRTALCLLQSFDPPGVGASSVSDCLLLQLGRFESGIRPQVLQCARDMAGGHLALLAAGNLAGLRRKLGCDLEVLREARQVLLRLNPKPGRDWAQDVADFVRPEVVV